MWFGKSLIHCAHSVATSWCSQVWLQFSY